MKKLLLLMVIATIATNSFGQFGVQAGATFATLKITDNTSGSGSMSTSSKVGFTVGVFTDVPLSENFIFQPALNYTQKGGKTTDTFQGITDESNLTLNYLELPLNFIYKPSGGFFVGLGPTLAYGISGKSKETVTGSSTQETTVKFGSGADQVKAFEFSGNILAGYTLSNGIFFSVNYNMGFSNLSNDNSEKIKNNYFGIRLGKKFGSGMMHNK